jgi:prolyl-tRNA synthetase
MRISNFLLKTSRNDYGDAESSSHRLLLRSGMIQQLASGVYSYTPLAQKSLLKISNIVRHEIDMQGGLEVRMPALQPRDIWEKTGRDLTFGLTLFSFKDRRNRELVLAPTHEEAATILASSLIESYRDLPTIIYQIQNKFRDESRPRAGLIRVREFDMMDAYSFDRDFDGLNFAYQKMVIACKRIFERLELPVIMAEADSGAIGGKESHEFIFPAATGEDTVISCKQCSYAANVERAEFKHIIFNNEDPKPIDQIYTPNIKTIDDVAEFLELSPQQTLKAVFYCVDNNIVMVMIRGDLLVNETKLQRIIGAKEIRLATTDESLNIGLVPGSASAIGMKLVTIVADESVKWGSNFVSGANKLDYHFTNVNYPRDFQVDLIGDIAVAQTGFVCPRCSGLLDSHRGIEVGHVFKVGTSFSVALDALYLDDKGAQNPLVMGCYGIGIGRLLAAVIEEHNDEKGILFPNSVTPFQIYLAPINMDKLQVINATEGLYKDLIELGFDVLFDDRNVSPGVKLNDADLLGFPVRLIVSSRTLKDNSAEVKLRSDSESIQIPLNGIIARISEIFSK